jgi:hypothetical protein
VRERVLEGSVGSIDFKEAKIDEKEYNSFVNFITSGYDTQYAEERVDMLVITCDPMSCVCGV